MTADYGAVDRCEIFLCEPCHRDYWVPYPTGDERCVCGRRLIAAFRVRRRRALPPNDGSAAS